MAPGAHRILTCFSINVHVPVPAGEEAANGSSAKNRPWTGEIKRKILASARRERVSAVRTEEEGKPCDANGSEKQSVPDHKVVEQRQATTAQGLRSALKRGSSSFPRDDGAPESIAVAVAGGGIVRERKGLRVRFDLPAAEETVAAPVVEPPPRLFPTGLLGEPPPESFGHSGPGMTAAFLMCVTGADAGSATAIDDRELLARWTERKDAASRRLRYLRDYCPFRREDDYDEDDEESTLETTTLPGEPHHAEAAPSPRVKKTGLPFDSPESEAEFVKAIRSRYHGALVHELKAS